MDKVDKMAIEDVQKGIDYLKLLWEHTLALTEKDFFARAILYLELYKVSLKK